GCRSGREAQGESLSVSAAGIYIENGLRKGEIISEKRKVKNELKIGGAKSEERKIIRDTSC
ncbi:MAG: hypothetical protein LBS20_09675, partial [Prevotella sp.]|nr:hypothetical protein [Prevotella sp.]